MAVIVKYVVVRDGDEKMTFATRKEADAHDRMLDIAENMYQFLKREALGLNEEQLDGLSLLLASKKEVILQLLKGGKLPRPGKTTKEPPTEDPPPKENPEKKQAEKSDAVDGTDGTDGAVDGSDEGKKKKTKTGRQKKTA